MRLIGYGICGAGEANRYMKNTLDQFKLFCDTTVIVLNNATEAEYRMVKSYGFHVVEDNREWGKDQWRIKQELLDKHIAPLEPDWCLALDMDETIHNFKVADLEEYEKVADSLYVYIVNLWNKGQKLERNFWNVRLWRWTGDTRMKQKSLHCGLSPEWTYHYGVYSKILLKHYGLKEEKDRQKKIMRYNKYDPSAKFIDKSYYDSLADNTSDAFIEKDVMYELNYHWSKYKPIKKKTIQNTMATKFVYVRRVSDGLKLDIPEHQLEETMARGGFQIIGDAGEKKPEQEPVVPKIEQPVQYPPEVEEKQEGVSCETCGKTFKNERGLKIHSSKCKSQN